MMIILADDGDPEEFRRATDQALAAARETHYPGHQDWGSPDHGISDSGWVVSMEYFLTHRRTHNHPMAQAPRQGRIFTRKPEDVARFEHDGDTSDEWELVTLHKLKLGARQVHGEWSDGCIYQFRDPRPGEIFTIPGGNAYWRLWHAGSAILSLLGVAYPDRFLVNMAQLLKDNDPRWTHQLVSDLDCLDQYNWCACEVVVTSPIPDLPSMWKALAVDQGALWSRIEELSGCRLASFLEEEEAQAELRRQRRSRG